MEDLMNRRLVTNTCRWSFLACLLTMCACASWPTVESMPPQDPTLGVEAWNSKRAALAGISTAIDSGREFRLERYSQAVCYFEQVTGLPAHDDGTDIGRIPTGHLRDDLDQWDRWLKD